MNKLTFLMYFLKIHNIYSTYQILILNINLLMYIIIKKLYMLSNQISSFYGFIVQLKKFYYPALAGMAEWIEHQPANQKVTGSIPGQSTCLYCRPGTAGGIQGSASLHTDVSLVLFLPPFLSF